MEYGKIINRSIEIAWQHKFLWLFGMFAGGGGFYLDFSAFIDLEQDPEYIFDNIRLAPELIYSFLFGILIWIGVMILIKLLSEIAVIDSVNRIERGGIFSFGTAFSSSLDFFFRYLGLAIFKFFVIIATFGALVLLLVLLFAITAILGFMFLILLIPAVLFIFFVINNVFSLAERAMIVRRSSIMASLEEGYYLFKTNFSDNFIIFLIFIGLSIVFGIASFILWMFFGIPIGIVTTLLGFEMMTAFVAAFILGLPISLIVGGIAGIFFSNIYTLFYFELVEPKQKREIPPPQIYGLDNSQGNPPEMV